jgi:hypothetical protein
VVGTAQVDTFNGAAGDDFFRGSGDDDRINGGAGLDWSNYRNAAGAVTVNLEFGTSSGADGDDTLISIEGWHVLADDTLMERIF